MLNNEDVKRYLEVSYVYYQFLKFEEFILQTKPDQIKETYRYLLPALLHIPIYHFEQYLIYLEVRIIFEMLFLRNMILFLKKLALFPESETAQLTDVLSVLRQNSYHAKRPKLYM